MPSRSYPAREPFWSERNRSHREYHGDPLHCAIHPESAPGWLCPKCRSYLCVDCVENVPLLKGGAERMLCLACEFEAPPLAAAGVSNKKGLTALFKR